MLAVLLSTASGVRALPLQFTRELSDLGIVDLPLGNLSRPIELRLFLHDQAQQLSTEHVCSETDRERILA